MTKHPSGRFLTNIGKNCDIYLSLPNPGPIIQEWIAGFQAIIFSNHSLWTKVNSSSVYLVSASETKTGWTIISGE